MHVTELLEAEPDAPRSWSTGLDGLDRVTGGLSPGQLWVITGAPGTGRTLLLTQLAHRLATEHTASVVLHAARRDPPEDLRARLLALSLRRFRTPPGRDDRAPVEPKEQVRLQSLRQADLEIHLGGGWSIPHGGGDRRPACLAIDEPECGRPPILDRSGLDALRAYADEPALVLVTVPRSHCLDRSESVVVPREEWASVADVIVEIGPSDDFGRATLHVRRNRRGPVDVVDVHHEPHLARFVER